MIEILQIIFFSLVFILLLFLPFNIFSKVNFFNNVDVVEKTSLNLVINLNIFLLLSFLPLSIQSIQPIVVLSYSLILIISYRKNFNLILKFLKSYLPLFVIFFLFSVHISTEIFLGWDAKYFYYIKSLFFYEGKTIFDLYKFEYSAWHPHYGSYLWGFFWSLSFVDSEYFGRLFYLFLFCYSFFVISKINKNQLINNIIFLILIFLFYEYKFFSGLQEILIFSFLILISKYFFLISRKNNNNEILFLSLIFLYSNLLIWIKSEGVVYFFIFLILLFAQNQILIKRKIFTASLFIIFYILKLIIYEISDLDNGQKTLYNLEYILNLDFNIIFYKLANIFVWFFYYLSNNIFFSIFILLMFYEKFFVKKKDKKNSIYYKSLMIYLLFITIFIISAYIFRDMEIVYAIRTTMDRLIMTASGFFIYPSIKLLGNKFYQR
jgi:hypothetical protein